MEETTGTFYFFHTIGERREIGIAIGEENIVLKDKGNRVGNELVMFGIEL